MQPARVENERFAYLSGAPLFLLAIDLKIDILFKFWTEFGLSLPLKPSLKLILFRTKKEKTLFDHHTNF